MGSIDFDKGVLVLAPLAGFSDLPFRSVVKKFGADLTFSEMISSNALVQKSKKTLHMLKKSPLEKPYIVQIAGSDPKVIKEAIKILNDIDGIDGIDLNCGCPVPKVVSQGAGSALLKNLPLMQKIIETIKEHSNKEYTSAKVRIGFVEKNILSIAQACQKAGVDFITVHGRTRAGGYKADVDYEAIKFAKQSVSIPVIANGDIDSFQKAKWVRDYTGCKSLMIGRAAVGNPWLFYQIKNSLESLDKAKISMVVSEHFEQILNFYGERGIVLFRKHLHTYSKGLEGASAFRNKVNQIAKADKMKEAIEEFFRN